MARLFIGPREQAFIADITKEFTKDCLGTFVLLFPISPLYTQVHPVYDEAIEKIFESPIKLDVLAGSSWSETEPSWDGFGTESNSKIEIYVQCRDLIDKEVQISGGDFFVFGQEVYEIVGTYVPDFIYGQVEYEKARVVVGKLARSGQLDIDTFKRLLYDSKTFQESQVQKEFIQQRGLEETEEGFTADKRQMRERLGDDMAPIALGEGPRKVAEDRDDLDEAQASRSSKFYHEG